MHPAGPLGAGIGLFVVAFLFQIIVTMARSGKLARNSSVGIRTKATRASDSAWAAGHKAALPQLQGAAIVGFVCSSMAIAWSIVMLATDKRTLVPMFVVLAGFFVTIVMVIMATVTANAAARKA